MNDAEPVPAVAQHRSYLIPLARRQQMDMNPECSLKAALEQSSAIASPLTPRGQAVRNEVLRRPSGGALLRDHPSFLPTSQDGRDDRPGNFSATARRGLNGRKGRVIGGFVA